MISSPEYNYSITGVLKKAQDWASTNSLGNLMEGKITAIMGASRGNFGTTRVQLRLRQLLHAMNAKVLNRPEVLVRNDGELIRSEKIIDERTIKKIMELLSELEKALIKTRNT